MFNFKLLFADETIKIHRVADRICDQAGRDGHKGVGGMP